MYDSLVLSNSIELLDGGVASTHPMCPGAIFQLQPGADPGAPQPTTDFVAGLLLDGERPFGRRASNRLIKLPVWITAPNRQIHAAAREYLQFVGDFIGVPIAVIGVGPSRNQVIWTQASEGMTGAAAATAS